MAKLYFKYGAMGSSKSAQALITQFNYEELGMTVWLIKPSIDTRDGADIIKSRIGLARSAQIITPDQDIVKEYAKANPGVVKMADSGVGAAPNVAAKAFEKYFDISFDFYTYDGAPECVTAVETNEVDATFLQPTPATASVKAGTLSMIGVLSDERLASFPDTPTIMETFGEEYNLVMKGFVALSAPAGTPDDVVAALRDLMGKAVESD